MARSGQALGRRSMRRVLSATARPAGFTRRSRSVSNCATRRVERLGIGPRRGHNSQQAPVCGIRRDWLAAAGLHGVRSAARWRFHALMWFSAWPRRQWRFS